MELNEGVRSHGFDIIFKYEKHKSNGEHAVALRLFEETTLTHFHKNC